jgi:hypothetical protein
VPRTVPLVIGFEGQADANDASEGPRNVATTRALGFLALVAVAVVLIAAAFFVVAAIVVVAYMIYTVPRA